MNGIPGKTEKKFQIQRDNAQYFYIKDTLCYGNIKEGIISWIDID